MSVAFRRESDDEHLEPKFELSIPPGPNLVAPRGLALIEAKVGELEAAITAAPDDETRTALKRDLRYWHTRHATAEIAQPLAEGEIGVSSRVTFRLNGAERTIAIVGTDEADPDAGLIGFQAPLARALIGGEVGERVDFNGKPDAIEVIAIDRSR